MSCRDKPGTLLVTLRCIYLHVIIGGDYAAVEVIEWSICTHNQFTSILGTCIPCVQKFYWEIKAQIFIAILWIILMFFLSYYQQRYMKFIVTLLRSWMPSNAKCNKYKSWARDEWRLVPGGQQNMNLVDHCWLIYKFSQFIIVVAKNFCFCTWSTVLHVDLAKPRQTWRRRFFLD